MGTHENAPLGQELLGHPSGEHQGRGEPPGEVPAPPVVLEAAVAHMGGVVGVAGAGQILCPFVVPRAGIRVLNHGAQGGPGGMALEQAGEDVGLVRLPPGGGQGVFSRGPAAEVKPDGVQVQGQAGGHALQHHADGGAVGFAE